MKKVLIIAPQQYPIPAVQGGAVETLITHLLNKNEIFQRVKFYVISTFNREATKHSYQYSKIYYVKSRKTLDIFSLTLRNLVKKFFYNRFTKRFIKYNFNYSSEWTLFGLQSYRITKKVKPDIIVSESYDQLNRLWPIVKKFKNAKFFYHLHYVKEENLSLREMFPNTIAISNFVLNHWVKDNSIKGENCVLYNAIDLEKFSIQISDERRNYLRNSLGLSSSDFVVLFTGRLRPHKGILELLNSFQTIQNNRIKLLILGDFLSETNRENKMREENFEQQCNEIIQSNKNIIRLGKISYEQISDYYKIADIQCIPSMWEEGAGLITIEGMASGLPLVITRSGGMPEYVGNGCALIVDRDENLRKNIAEAILRLYSDQNLRIQMSKCGQNQSLKFSIEDYYDNYIKIILG